MSRAAPKAVFLLACLLAAGAALCVKQQLPPGEMAAGENTPATQSATGLGEDAFSFRVELEGQVYALPFSAAQLAAQGWVPQADLSGHELMPGEGCAVTWAKTGQQVDTVLVNLEESALPALDCAIGQISGAGLVLPGRVACGSTREEALAALGAPNSPEGRQEAAVLEYTVAKNSEIALEMSEDGRVSSIRVKNYIALAEPWREINWPQEVLAWQAPAALPENGQEWPGFILEYGGGLYALPMPVKALLEDGWRFRNAEDAMKIVETGGFVVAAYLQKGSQAVRVNLENYAPSPQPWAACFVTLLETGQSGPFIDFRLAGGIGWQASSGQVAAALGEGFSTVNSSGRTRMIYETEYGRLRLDFSDYGGAEERLEYVLVQAERPKEE